MTNTATRVEAVQRLMSELDCSVAKATDFRNCFRNRVASKLADRRFDNTVPLKAHVCHSTDFPDVNDQSSQGTELFTVLSLIELGRSHTDLAMNVLYAFGWLCVVMVPTRTCTDRTGAATLMQRWLHQNSPRG